MVHLEENLSVRVNFITEINEISTENTSQANIYYFADVLKTLIFNTLFGNDLFKFNDICTNY